MLNPSWKLSKLVVLLGTRYKSFQEGAYELGENTTYVPTIALEPQALLAAA